MSPRHKHRQIHDSSFLPAARVHSLLPAEGPAKPSASEPRLSLEGRIAQLEAELQQRARILELVEKAGGYPQFVQGVILLRGNIAGLRESSLFPPSDEGSAQPSEASSPDV